MEIQEYVAEKEKRLARSSQRIRNFEVFDFNYIPEKPLMRDEVKPIVDALLRYEKTGIANHLLLVGSRGSGKTLLVKYLMKVLALKHDLGFEYANCRTHNTSFKILASLLGVRPRGLALEELWERFKAGHGGKTVLVLDEVDLLSEKDTRKDILYLVSRSQENYMAVLLSNNPKFLGLLDESVRSTLQPEVVHFRNYSAPQIERILRERAVLGLRRVPKVLLRKIAALTARNTNSDVRVGIKTLYYSALEPQAGLSENFERARRDILIELIRDLNDRNLLILKSAQDVGESHVKAVYERYRQLSARFQEEPFSYVHFYSNLSYLQSLGLILLVSTKVGRTYTNRIQLLFSPELLQAVWEARFR